MLPTGTAVLNADDSIVASLAAYCEGSVTFYSLDPTHTVVVDHLKQGHRAVIVEQGRVVLAHGASRTALMSIDACPTVSQASTDSTRSAVLAAAAAAWALGMPTELIEAGLISPLV